MIKNDSSSRIVNWKWLSFSSTVRDDSFSKNCHSQHLVLRKSYKAQKHVQTMKSGRPQPHQLSMECVALKMQAFKWLILTVLSYKNMQLTTWILTKPQGDVFSRFSRWILVKNRGIFARTFTDVPRLQSLCFFWFDSASQLHRSERMRCWRGTSWIFIFRKHPYGAFPLKGEAIFSSDRSLNAA